MTLKLKRKEVLVLVLAILIGVVNLLMALHFYRIAFPEASIDFKVSKEEALKVAKDFLAKEGFQVQSYLETIVFDYDYQAKVYLERELGLEAANRLTSSEVNVWYWRARFFKPLQKEEFRAYIDPGGKIVGFSHRIEEKTKGKDLALAEAKKMAIKFLEDLLGDTINRYKLLEEETLRRPNRTDHTFTWERIGFKAKEATYRLAVTIRGDEVGGYGEYLKIPEEWQRDYAKLRSKNWLAGRIAYLFRSLLLIAIFVTFLFKAREGNVKWRIAIGLSLFVGFLQVIQSLNSWPLTLSSYDTTKSYGSFIVEFIFDSFLGASFSSLTVFLVAASGEALYREMYKDKISLANLFTRQGIKTRKFFRGSIIGLMFALAHMGFIVLFYHWGRKLGVWSPAEINYDNTVSTSLPWIYPLTLGVTTAIDEEFIYRLFAIPFLKKYLGSTWLSLTIPALIWSFGHSTYPQQPFFIRGIELGIIGVIAGLIMIRFGIWANLVWHYSVDAFLIGLFLLRSSSPYFLISGWFVVGGALIPLVVALLTYLSRRGFLSNEEMLNWRELEGKKEPLTIPRVEAKASYKLYEALTRKKVFILFLAAILGLVALFTVKTDKFGSFVKFHITRGEAQRISDLYLKKRGIRTDEFKKVTTIVSELDSLEARYILRALGIREANRIFEGRIPAVYWRVRYFKPLIKEEYRVLIDLRGKVYSYEHILDEKAPGANLSQREALKLAERYLQEEKGIALNHYKLVGSEMYKRDWRTDYYFSWETEKDRIQEGRFRVFLEVIGDEVSDFKEYLHVPEYWIRQEEEMKVGEAIFKALNRILFWMIMLFLLTIFIFNFVKRKVNWKLSLSIASLLTFFLLLSKLNRLSLFYSSYRTYLSLANYFSNYSLSLIQELIFNFLLLVLLVSLAHSNYRETFPQCHPLPLTGEEEFRYYLDALLLGGASVFLAGGALRLYHYFDSLLNLSKKSTGASLPSFMDHFLPALESLYNALFFSALLTAAIAIGASLFKRYFPRKIIIAPALLGIIAILSGAKMKGLGEYLENLLSLLALLSLSVIFVTYFFKHNLLAYLVAFSLGTLLNDSIFLIKQPHLFYQVNGLILILLAFLSGLALLVKGVHSRWKSKIITILTDFGLEDGYVATMKGVILRINPKVQIVDISQGIGAQDISAAAFILGTSYKYFPRGTVHLVVVDPGVGSERRAIAVKTKDHYFVAPDNGVLSYILEKEAVEKVIELKNRQYFLEVISDTFHGRDIFAPVAAYLSKGVNISKLGEEIKDYVRIPIVRPQVLGTRELRGEIIHVDRFGNLITNISRELWESLALQKAFIIKAQKARLGKINRSYTESKRGEALAIFGSFGLLEISVNQGNAQKRLGLKRGDRIEVKFKEGPL